jgi:hypothetical protein
LTVRTISAASLAAKLLAKKTGNVAGKKKTAQPIALDAGAAGQQGHRLLVRDAVGPPELLAPGWRVKSEPLSIKWGLRSPRRSRTRPSAPEGYASPSKSEQRAQAQASGTGVRIPTPPGELSNKRPPLADPYPRKQRFCTSAVLVVLMRWVGVSREKPTAPHSAQAAR